MLISRVSPLTGLTNVLDLPVTQEQMNLMALPASQRPYSQDIFPDLTPDEREFIMTGYTTEDWDSMFGEDTEDCPHCGRNDMPVGACESDDCPSNSADNE